MSVHRLPSHARTRADGEPTAFYWTEAVLNHSRARGIERTILLAIAISSGPGGAFPGNDRLRTYAGGPGDPDDVVRDHSGRVTKDGRVAARSVWRAIQHLEEMGELRVHQHGGGFPDDRRPVSLRPNRYEVLVHCTEWCQRGRHFDSPPPDSPLWK